MLGCSSQGEGRGRLTVCQSGSTTGMPAAVLQGLKARSCGRSDWDADRICSVSWLLLAPAWHHFKATRWRVCHIVSMAQLHEKVVAIHGHVHYILSPSMFRGCLAALACSLVQELRLGKSYGGQVNTSTHNNANWARTLYDATLQAYPSATVGAPLP